MRRLRHRLVEGSRIYPDDEWNWLRRSLILGWTPRYSSDYPSMVGGIALNETEFYDAWATPKVWTCKFGNASWFDNDNTSVAGTAYGWTWNPPGVMSMLGAWRRSDSCTISFGFEDFLPISVVERYWFYSQTAFGIKHRFTYRNDGPAQARCWWHNDGEASVYANYQAQGLRDWQGDIFTFVLDAENNQRLIYCNGHLAGSGAGYSSTPLNHDYCRIGTENVGKMDASASGWMTPFVYCQGAWTPDQVMRHYGDPVGWARIPQTIRAFRGMACLEARVSSELRIDGKVGIRVPIDAEVGSDLALDAEVDAVSTLDCVIPPSETRLSAKVSSCKREKTP